ncbi:hypothetical protein E2562_009381 [Oryza meyeriana var. granulata]|uniref:Uncharacterized protein n=1 Tax=Oryza meyeriana var. granulata TaxID=110450 RepID=A0A6G1CF39_9ORYZ|nr:hypothetical protein E2562_009381 [Oryza meyeriana var. granulata]
MEDVVGEDTVGERDKDVAVAHRIVAYPLPPRHGRRDRHINVLSPLAGGGGGGLSESTWAPPIV